MAGFITEFPAKKAALVAGVAFIVSVLIVTLIDNFLLAKFAIPADTAALSNDIIDNRIHRPQAVSEILEIKKHARLKNLMDLKPSP